MEFINKIIKKIKPESDTAKILTSFERWYTGYVTGVDAQTGELLVAIDSSPYKPLRDLHGVQNMEYVNAIELYLRILEG